MKYPPIDLGDGHKCYSGPDCQLHGTKHAEETIAAAERAEFLADAVAQEKTSAVDPVTTYSIPTNRIADAVAQVDKANKKLARYPEITERYTYEIGEAQVVQRRDYSYTVQPFTVNKPVLRINGWSFAAAHEFTANGDVTTYVADQDVADQLGSKPVDNHCDYCGSNRSRERVYWLKGEGGEVKQVGSTCLKGFLGVKPSGLWALESDLDLTSFGGGGGVDSRVYDREQLITAALAASNDGESFIAGSRSDFKNPATGDVVVEGWEQFSNAEFSPERLEKTRAILNWLDGAEDDPGSYIGNLKAALGSGNWVKRKHVRLAVSAIAAHANHLQREAANKAREERLANQKDKPFGDEGAKIKSLRLKVTNSKFLPNGFGGTTLLTMEDADGNVVKWFASSASYDKGDEILVKSATVKGNEEFRGEYQTLIKNARTEMA